MTLDAQSANSFQEKIYDYFHINMYSHLIELHEGIQRRGSTSIIPLPSFFHIHVYCAVFNYNGVKELIEDLIKANVTYHCFFLLFVK